MDVLMELSRILITELGDQQVIFLREKNGPRNFPIMIGIAEAMAIDRRLKGKPTPRPMTHDLLASVIGALGGTLTKIVINDIIDHTFIATLHIQRDGEMIEIDSRPSDAIALGVAFDTPIYVAEHVLDNVLSEPASKEDKIELLRQRLEMLREAIDELTEQLGDAELIAKTPANDVEESRRQLAQMQHEYDAISRVLKKIA